MKLVYAFDHFITRYDHFPLTPLNFKLRLFFILTAAVSLFDTSGILFIHFSLFSLISKQHNYIDHHLYCRNLLCAETMLLFLAMLIRS